MTAAVPTEIPSEIIVILLPSGVNLRRLIPGSGSRRPEP